MQQTVQMTLRAARINKGLRQEDVAAALGVGRKTVSSWEKGKSMPSAGRIPDICNVLGVSYDNIKWKP
jgi:transcriptional regulator with XRE-family HTH domain